MKQIPFEFYELSQSNGLGREILEVVAEATSLNMAAEILNTKSSTLRKILEVDLQAPHEPGARWNRAARAVLEKFAAPFTEEEWEDLFI